jgi:hypothetical protein
LEFLERYVRVAPIRGQIKDVAASGSDSGGVMRFKCGTGAGCGHVSKRREVHKWFIHLVRT